MYHLLMWDDLLGEYKYIKLNCTTEFAKSFRRDPIWQDYDFEFIGF